MSSGDQSMIIANQLCHKCHQIIDETTDGQSCSNCCTPATDGSVTLIQTSPAPTLSGQTSSAEISSEEEIPKVDKPTALCSVCLEALDGRMSELALNCGHRFHSRCIDEWLHNKNTCPLCRQIADPNWSPPIELNGGADRDGQHVMNVTIGGTHVVTISGDFDPTSLIITTTVSESDPTQLIVSIRGSTHSETSL